MEGAVALCILAAVGGLWWVVSRGGLDGAKYRVVVRPQETRVYGEVPGYSVGEVVEFISTLQLPPGSAVRGVPEGERIVLRFSDQVPDHLHQRLRNFFYLRR